MKMNKSLLSLLLFFMVRAGSSFVHAQQAGKSIVPTDSIDRMIATAAKIGKTDTAAALIIFKDALAKTISLKDDFRSGRVFFEMGNMFFIHKNHNRSFGAYFN